ncbi:unnamed protein product [Musa hybrid cultivar]
MMMMMMPKVNGNSHRKGFNAPGKTKFGRFWNGSHTGASHADVTASKCLMQPA